MPVFTAPATFQNANGTASIGVEVVINTGSEFDLIPETWLEQLHLPVVGEEEVDVADGIPLRMRIAAVSVTMLGRTRVVNAYVGPADTRPLIGSSTLSDFGFEVEPEGRLLPQVFRL